jgi:hypothetical protein
VNTIDDYCREQAINQVDVLKIDVEGAELLVLRGGQQLLAATRPIIILELHPQQSTAFGYTVADTVQFLRHQGYKPVHAGPHAHRPAKAHSIFTGKRQTPDSHRPAGEVMTLIPGQFVAIGRTPRRKSAARLSLNLEMSPEPYPGCSPYAIAVTFRFMLPGQGLAHRAFGPTM